MNIFTLYEKGRYNHSISQSSNKDVTVQHMHGFTLVELVIVILVISLLAVMPFYNWPGTTVSIDAQARLIANDIRYTQSLAMSKNERYRFVRTSATTYQIQNSSGTAITFPNGSTTQTLNSGLSFGTWTNLSNNLIAFDSQGVPYSDTGSPGTALVAGTTYSVVITGGGNTDTITVTPITGRVVVQ